MKKGIVVLSALILMAPLMLTAQADPPDEFFCPRGQGHMGFGHRAPDGDRPQQRERGLGVHRLLMAADEIGLSDEQQDQLKQMGVEFKMQQIDRQAELKKARLQLHAYMREQDAVEGDVMRMIDDVSRLEADVRKMRYVHQRQVRALLSDEQADKLKELRKARLGERKGRMEGEMRMHRPGRRHP